MGVNYAFAPIIDIDYNTLNPITNTRTFGNDPETVYEMAAAYIDGLMEGGRDMCYSIKHFPGDGVDNRDQHLHTTYNTLSVQEWDETYGRNYQRLIEKGATTVMVRAGGTCPLIIFFFIDLEGEAKWDRKQERKRKRAVFFTGFRFI